VSEKQIIEFCLRNNITVNQYFILYLTKRRWEGFRQEFVDYTKSNPWSQEELLDLLSKNLIAVEFHEPGTPIEPISIRLLEDKDIFQNTDMGEELWNAYPPAFTFSHGGMFIARTGMPKDKFIDMYLEKIGRNPEKHSHVMKQLDRYVKLVQTGKINGHKLSDWVANEIWDTIASMPGESTGSPFKRSV